LLRMYVVSSTVLNITIQAGGSTLKLSRYFQLYFDNNTLHNKEV
jgi:hypothetical protein